MSSSSCMVVILFTLRNFFLLLTVFRCGIHLYLMAVFQSLVDMDVLENNFSWILGLMDLSVEISDMLLSNSLSMASERIMLVLSWCDWVLSSCKNLDSSWISEAIEVVLWTCSMSIIKLCEDVWSWGERYYRILFVRIWWCFVLLPWIKLLRFWWLLLPYVKWISNNGESKLASYPTLIFLPLESIQVLVIKFLGKAKISPGTQIRTCVVLSLVGNKSVLSLPSESWQPTMSCIILRYAVGLEKTVGIICRLFLFVR